MSEYTVGILANIVAMFAAAFLVGIGREADIPLRIRLFGNGISAAVLVGIALSKFDLLIFLLRQ